MKILVVFVLLAAAAALEAVLAEEKYFEIGGKLSLEPESVPTEGITNINWKHEGNFVAEWVKDKVDLSYFGNFKDRTDLNTFSGELIIRSMTKADEGTFTVEINTKAQTVGYSARGVTHLRDKKVEVVNRPLICDTSFPHCNLSCLADVADAEPVQYFWQNDEGPWKESQKDMNISNDEETRQIKTFSCKIKNPISEKNSEPQENPFIKKTEEENNGGLIVGIIFLVLLILGGVGLSVFAYKHPERVAPCLPCVAGHPEQRHSAESPRGGDTMTYNGTLTAEPNESSVTVHQKTEANTETSNKTSSDPDESSEVTPLTDSKTVTSNGTPDQV